MSYEDARAARDAARRRASTSPREIEHELR